MKHSSKNKFLCKVWRAIYLDEFLGEILNVCYVSDNGYLPYALVSCYSVIENNKGKKINIYILTVGEIDNQYIDWGDIISKDDYNIYFIKADKYISILNDTVAVQQFYLEAYIRIFISDILPLSVKYCYYLDVDTIVCHELKSKVMGGDFSVYAVKDTWNSKYNPKIGMNKENNYFNSGVLYIDIEKWKKEMCGTKLLKNLQNLKKPYRLNDQDLINVVLKEQIGVLPPEYNMLPAVRSYSYQDILKYSNRISKGYYSYEEIKKAKESPYVIHYAGFLYEKPWKRSCSDPDKETWYYYYHFSGVDKMKKIESYEGFRFMKKKIKSVIIKKLPKKLLWYIDYAKMRYDIMRV